MTTLEKAVLEELGKDGKVVPGSAVAVQFNPASLKLQMTNSTDGAAARGRQVQQYNGSASTSLSVQLEFDTADEGTTDEPADVRGRTSQVARFVLPGAPGSKNAPPRVQFRWGTVIVGGVMTSMSEELTLFSGHGVPLRAAVAIDIKQQNPEFEALEAGPGANRDTGAPPAGEPGAGTAAADDRTAEALDGESAADFLARNGLDPAAWRAVAGLLDDPLSLSAGLAVDFSGSLSVSAGVGVSLGFAADLNVPAGASLGLEGGASAGLALAEAGGVTAAAETLAAGAATAEADRAR
ncbi:CIS tube protein, partial [Paractinoplanes deccanensis]